MGKKTGDANKSCGRVDVQSVIPKRRQDLLKWNGWGYNDSKFVIKDGIVHFTGNRYPIGELALPYFTQWAKDVLGLDLQSVRDSKPPPTSSSYPPPNVSDQVLNGIANLEVSYSVDVVDRVVRAHGHTLHDIHTLREGTFERIPDVVVWPQSHDDVAKIVRFADDNNLVVIPFGGGTAVSGAVECPRNEPRTIISLDTSQMNSILWVDGENLVACCESGIIGQDLEREMGKLGYMTGHEPDSFEFSSLGGWVATRASGMKKNVYGNIEDLLVHVKMVTTKGVLEKSCQVPRMSCGPDFNHVILGSEGSLGVVTEVVLKIRPLPQCKKYGSVVFPDFESGVKCMREIARERCQPASVRLMDNEQFKFGQSLKAVPGMLGFLVDEFKKLLLTKLKRFDLNKMCVMTLLFEGGKKEVEDHEKRIYAIAKKYGGIPAGETNGLRGYMLTFVIAYIRDLAADFSVVAESFETSVPWDRALALCRKVKHRIAIECNRRNIKHHFVCCRVTQTYDAGCVIYFYFAYNYVNHSDPVQVYEEIEDVARDEILAVGGSISHHHGVGKLRKKWYPATVSQVGVGLFRNIKKELDPNNVFATGNLVEAKL